MSVHESQPLQALPAAAAAAEAVHAGGCRPDAADTAAAEPRLPPRSASLARVIPVLLLLPAFPNTAQHLASASMLGSALTSKGGAVSSRTGTCSSEPGGGGGGGYSARLTGNIFSRTTPAARSLAGKQLHKSALAACIGSAVAAPRRLLGGAHAHQGGDANIDPDPQASLADFSILHQAPGRRVLADVFERDALKRVVEERRAARIAEATAEQEEHFRRFWAAEGDGLQSDFPDVPHEDASHQADSLYSPDDDDFPIIAGFPILEAADVDTVKAAYEQAEAHLSALEGLVPALQQHYWEAPRPSLPARLLRIAHLIFARLSSSVMLLIGRYHLEHRSINVHAAAAATRIDACGRSKASLHAAVAQTSAAASLFFIVLTNWQRIHSGPPPGMSWLAVVGEAMCTVALGAAMVGHHHLLHRSRSIHAAALAVGTTETVIATLLGAHRSQRF